MSRRTGTSRGSSRSSAARPQTDRLPPGPIWEIDPLPSRLLAAWHVSIHALAVGSVLMCGLPWPVKLVASAALLAHAAWRRPSPPTPLRRHADGAWSLPALGLDGLSLRAGTAVGPFWVRLELGSARSTVATVLLLTDQLNAEDWRRLQAELRALRQAGTV